MKKGIILLAIIGSIGFTGCDGATSNNTSTNVTALPQDKDNIENLFITVNGEKLEKSAMSFGVGEVGFPVKEIAEKLGFIVSQTDTKITIDTGRIIQIDLNEEGKIIVNENEVKLNLPYVVDNDEVYISAPELAELLGFEYMIGENEITIKSKPQN